MKKHDITQDTPSYSSDDEDKAAGGLARGEGGTSTTGSSYGHA